MTENNVENAVECKYSLGDTKELEEYRNTIMGSLYKMGILKPMKPFFGGCYYDKDYNRIYIREVIFNNPATIVFWSDGTKTTSVCDNEDTYDTEKGVLLCVLKKLVNSDFAVKTMEDWGRPAPGKTRKTLSDVRFEHKHKKD